MDELAVPGTIWGAAGAALMAVIGGFFWMRKALASTATDVAGERAHVDMLQVLLDENKSLRDRLELSEAARNELVTKMADLNAELKIIQKSQESLTNKISELTQTNAILTEKVNMLSSQLGNS